MTTRKSTPIWNATKIANNSAELTMYAPIEDEESWWYDSVTPKGVMRALNNLGKISEITVRINSNGGSAFAGLAIYQYLKDHDAKIIIKVDGIAASAASIIAMAGDEIVMGVGAMLMVHNPWTVAAGEAKDFRDTADFLDKVSESLISVYQERTGKDENELREMLNNTTWLTADEAISTGFADRVDRKQKVSASIKNGIVTFNDQKFDLRAFASIPPLFQNGIEDLGAEPQENIQTTEQALISVEGEGKIVNSLEELKEKYPDIYNQAVTAGEKKERERIAALNALIDAPGAAPIVAKAIDEGKTVGETAVEIVRASKERLTQEGSNRILDSQNSGLHQVPADKAPEPLNNEAVCQAEADALAAEIKALRGGSN